MKILKWITLTAVLGLAATKVAYAGIGFSGGAGGGSFNGGTITSTLTVSGTAVLNVQTTAGVIAGLGRAFNILYTVNPSASQIYAGLYGNVVNIGTTDNTGNVAHIIGGVTRTSDTAQSGTDSFAFEARNDFRSLRSGVEGTALFAYMDWISTGPASSIGTALRIRGWNTTAGLSASPSSTGTLRGIWIEDIVGGGSGVTHAIYSEADEPSYFAGPIEIAGASSSLSSGSNTSIALGVNGSTWTFYSSSITAPNGYRIDKTTQVWTVTIASGTGYNGLAIPLGVGSIQSSITITRIDAVALPTGATALWQLDERTLAGIGSAGTDVMTVSFATATSPGVTYLPSAMSNATLSSGSQWVLKTHPTAGGAGGPTSLGLTIYYKED